MDGWSLFANNTSLFMITFQALINYAFYWLVKSTKIQPLCEISFFNLNLQRAQSVSGVVLISAVWRPRSLCYSAAA